MPVLKPLQRKAFERSLASVQEAEQGLTFLNSIAQVSPQYAERAKQLRDRQTYLKALGEAALIADSSSQ